MNTRWAFRLFRTLAVLSLVFQASLVSAAEAPFVPQNPHSTTVPMTGAASTKWHPTSALPASLNWEDLGEGAPGETVFTALAALQTGKIVGGTIGTGTPYLVSYDPSASTFSPKMAVPGSGAHVSRLALGPNNIVYASTSRTFGSGNLAKYQGESIADLGTIGDEYGEALTVGLDGRVYVATCCQGVISVYNPQTQSWTYLGSAVSGQRRLSGLATASNGDIYGVSSRIWVYPYGGAVLYKINPANLSVSVLGTIWPGERESWNIVNNPHDNRLYGSVGYGMTARLFAYDPSQPGQGIQDLGPVTAGEDDVAAGSMVVGPDGKVYAVTNTSRHLIVYDPDNPAAGIVDKGTAYAPLALGSDMRLYGVNGTHIMRSEPIAGFLYLPFVSAQFAQSALGWTGLSGQGRVNSWFDHQYPTYGAFPNSQYPGLVKYTGDYYATTSQGRSWYDGHDGIDFTARIGSRDVRAAAGGSISAVYNTCNRTCNGGSCCEYLGNRVEIDHGNGYKTIYGHMEYESIPINLTVGTTVLQGDFLGRMGNTGNSDGPHLHFAVRTRDNNRWVVMDPYGWAGTSTTNYQNDPWAQHSSGATSYYLWRTPLTQRRTFSASEGTSIGDNAGFATLDIGPASLGGMVSATLSNTPVPTPTVNLWRSLGRAFSVDLSTSPPEAPALELRSTSPVTYLAPITITMPYSSTDLAHFDGSELAIQHWNEDNQQWDALPTVIDPQNSVVTTETNLTGKFDLQAPLLCPAEVLEPDDAYDAAQTIWQNGPPVQRALDVARDSDWAMFEATGGVTYTIRTLNLAPGVDTVLSVYADTDTGPALVAANDNYTATLASGLDWVAPEDGTYYLAVTGSANSAVGCSATYELGIETLPGDITGDCRVDIVDIQRVANAWLLSVGQYGYLSVYDQDHNGYVDIIDIQIVASYWGSRCSG